MITKNNIIKLSNEVIYPYPPINIITNCKYCNYGDTELLDRFKEFSELENINSLSSYELDSLTLIDRIVQSKINNYDSIINSDLLFEYIELDYKYTPIDGNENWNNSENDSNNGNINNKTLYPTQ